MSAMVKPLAVQEAYEDLLQRSLSRISLRPGTFALPRLHADYNTGNYHHDGLADRFKREGCSQRAGDRPPPGFFTRLPLFRWKTWLATWRHTWNLPGKIQENFCALGSG